MSTAYKRLYRSRTDRMIGGVCSGLGEYFSIDPTIVRVVFVLGLFLGFGSLGFIYLVLLLVVPEEPYTEELPAEEPFTEIPSEKQKDLAASADEVVSPTDEEAAS